MIGLPIDQSTRTAATDGALSFSILLEKQRELTLGSAQSSVSGLLAAIKAAPSLYGSLVEAASSSLVQQGSSVSKLTSPKWDVAPGNVRNDIRASFASNLQAQVDAARTEATRIGTLATSLRNSAANPSPERNLAIDLEGASADVQAALTQLQNGNAQQAAQSLATTRTKAQAMLSSAQSLLSSLQSAFPPDNQRIDQTQALVAAILDLLTLTDTAAAIPDSALASTANQPTATYELSTDTSPTTYLTTIGDSGSIALTDATGQGILISADGRVDALPPGGDGWQFQSDSTFVLPDGTKISVSPGQPASVLATRGEQQIKITGLQSGQSPTVVLEAEGGRAADAARNDGYIFSMGASAQAWTLAGSPLGDSPGTREVVATTPLTNEVEIDVTITDVPPELQDLIAAMGLSLAAFDKDADGKLNDEEWKALTAALESGVRSLHTRFDASLSRTTEALEVLLRLNQFLTKVLGEADRQQAERQRLSAEQRDELLKLQAELAASQSALRSTETKSPGKTDVLGDARAILQEIDSFGREQPPDPAAPTTTAPPTSDPASALPDAANETTRNFRRAERILSGIGSGLASLKFAPPPTATPGVITPDAPASDLPAAPGLESSGEGLLVPDPTVDAEEPKTPPARDDVRPPASFPRETPPPAQTPSSSPALPSTRDSEPADRGVRRATPPPPLPPDLRPREAAVTGVIPPGIAQDPGPTPAPAPSILPPVSELRTPDATSRPEPVSPPKAPPPFAADFPPPSPGGQTPLPGTGFPATGPNPVLAPDPTFGASDGFQREFGRRISAHRAAYTSQLHQAQQVQGRVRQVVEQFLRLVGRDEQLRQIFQSDDLSDAERATFKGKVENLERDLGISWGSDPAKTPQGEANLNARLLGSGLKI